MIDYSQSYPADHRAVVNNSYKESATMIIPHFLDSAAYNNLHLSLSALSQSSLSPLSILSKLSLSLSSLKLTLLGQTEPINSLV